MTAWLFYRLLSSIILLMTLALVTQALTRRFDNEMTPYVAIELTSTGFDDFFHC